MAKELTVVEASRKLGLTLDTLYRLIYAGRLPARKADRRWLIPADAVEERLKRRGA
jgi:excisionase family DNA binding protein